MSYDYVIVGAGPCGLTLAHYLSKKYSILVIDKEDSIGGCHRVKRIRNMFTEHGPRIYMGNFVNFNAILEDMNVNFNDIFTKYDFSISDIGGNAFEHLTWREILIFIFTFLTFTKKDMQITMEDYMNYYKFSTRAKGYIDRLCRLTDGAGADRYTKYQFFQILNQNFFYNTYQPKISNDKGLFKVWREHLIKNNVKFMLNAKVTKISKDNLIIDNDKKILFKNVILAIPPFNLVKICNKSHIKLLDDISRWTELVKYETYIPIQFHWNRRLNLPKIWGFPKTEWGVAHIVLSDYMDFEDSTVISTCITIADEAKKIPNKNIIIDKAFKQLKESYPDLPRYDYAFMVNNRFYNGEWESVDNPFMMTKYGYIPTSTKYNNIHICGTHTGASNYSFTSMESAVTNAVNLVNKLEPQIKIEIKKGWTIYDILKLVILLLLVLIIYINEFRI